MYPTNQIILGGDSMFNPMDDIDIQIQKMEAYKNKLRLLQSQNNIQQNTKLIWDDIDAEVNPMTEEQKYRLMQDQEYAETYNELNIMVQNEILNLVKPRIEATEKGKELLSTQLKIVKKLKNKIIEATNREMEMFMAFREFSKTNPNVTYEEFIKSKTT